MVLTKIDALISPQETHVKTIRSSEIDTLVNDVTKLAGGLPDGQNLLEGLNLDSVTVTSLVALYAKSLKDGKLNVSFAKSMKNQIDLVMKDAYGIGL